MTYHETVVYKLWLILRAFCQFLYVYVQVLLGTLQQVQVLYWHLLVNVKKKSGKQNWLGCVI